MLAMVCCVCWLLVCCGFLGLFFVGLLDCWLLFVVGLLLVGCCCWGVGLCWAYIVLGAFISGFAKKGTVVSIYPGVVYHSGIKHKQTQHNPTTKHVTGDPVFFPSIRNSYVMYVDF